MLVVKLKPSRMLLFLLAAAHLLSLALVWILPIMPAMQIAGTLLLTASAAFYLRRDVLLEASSSITQLRLAQDCDCSCQTRDGTWLETRLLGSSMVTPWLTVLNFSIQGKWLGRNLVIFPDTSNPESLRKLRVLLRWKCGKASKG